MIGVVSTTVMAEVVVVMEQVHQTSTQEAIIQPMGGSKKNHNPPTITQVAKPQETQKIQLPVHYHQNKSTEKC